MVGCRGLRAQASDRYMPPRSAWKASGRSRSNPVAAPWAMRRRSSATVFRMPPSACASFSASRRARSYASSTITRRSTTKKIRRGAVIGCPVSSRDAWTAKANRATSMQAVLPDAVGKAMASGQGEGVAPPAPEGMPAPGKAAEAASRSSTLFAKSFCQQKGRLFHSAVKNSEKSEAHGSSGVTAGLLRISPDDPDRSRVPENIDQGPGRAKGRDPPNPPSPRSCASSIALRFRPPP